MSHITRVLVVDDSPTMRRLIRAGIEKDPAIQVVAEAGTAREAREAVKASNPDVMTLDVEMPGMNGLEFLDRLMQARPMPVIMISSRTAKGSETAVRALSLGAIDCVEKPELAAAIPTFSNLARKLRVAAKVQVRPARRGSLRPAVVRPGWQWNGKWILIGASTGGVDALETVLSEFPANCPPTLITQHMPAQFLVSLAARLNNLIAPAVSIAGDGDRPAQGRVLIAPGDATHLVLDNDGATVRLVAGPKRCGHRPSVDEMLLSAVPFAGNMVAAILTGMGRDGAEGMRELRRAGAICVGQDEASSVVYGMPRVAREFGGVTNELPLSAIGQHLLTQAAP